MTGFAALSGAFYIFFTIAIQARNKLVGSR